MRKEGFGPTNGSFDVNFNEYKEGNINGLFLFKEFEKIIKKTLYSYLWFFLDPR
jgi:hypothetical protein